MSFKSAFKRNTLAIAIGITMGLSGFAGSSLSLAASAPAEKPAAAKEEKKPIHILFTNVNIFDGFSPKLKKGMSVLVENNFIKEVFGTDGQADTSTNINSEEMDAILAQAAFESDPAKAQDLYAQAETIMVYDIAETPVRELVDFAVEWMNTNRHRKST